MMFEPGQQYRTADGVEGEVRVVNPGVNIRVTWKLPEWAILSTVQVRTIPSGKDTTISFRQEKLAGAAELEVMLIHWHKALQALEELMAT
ncbi:MAG: SRPBCC domain-containing protein [Anaerolineae bacterium]|nr:SRPBCC domain-containing protein [Anaerolineae bacterium]